MEHNHPLKTDPDMKQYFETLPKHLQESILQSGAEVNSVAQLQELIDRFR